MQDVVSLPGPGSSSATGFVAGPGYQQTIGMALGLDIDNSSSNAQQPWDGIMVGLLVL